MTDAAEPADSDTDAAEVDAVGESTVAQVLLALQAVDTEAAQLTHRRANSAVRDEFTSASTRATAWERERARLVARIDELGGSIDASEARGAELLAHRQRLDQQLKTVIAPREAEALMHEIDAIEAQRDELDVIELEALEQQSELDDQLAAHLQEQESVADTLRLADDALAAEVADIDAALERLAGRRAELRPTLSEQLLATYDRKQAALGVAVAALVGRQCQGCHLELSAAEVDTVRSEAAATGVTDCPECGRLLIV
jgi:predicted  nucleic acid-binding Zn-ribbon protein